MKQLILFILCSFFTTTSNCQNFMNGDLEGLIGSSEFGIVPDFWLKVPYYDINSLACCDYDTPDLTSINFPLITLGYNGNPFSGNTFVSGAYILNTNPNGLVQEGIMQTVSGFESENNYIIRFYQTVVKTIGALDKSGSWAVYVDTVLIGITEPTHSNETFDSNNLPWEVRSFEFTATAPSHLIKFLPMDNDTNYLVSYTDTTGALYMGIDSISLSLVNGTKEYSSKSYNLYPNPNTGNFKLQYNGILNKTTMLYITDVYGKIIDAKEIVNTTTAYENTSLLSGLYFYSLRQGNEAIGHGKFVVVK